MKAKVIDSLCIGCGSCVAIASEDFDINDEGLAYALNDKIINVDDAKEAKECCPTSSIIIEE